jgi:hypothetical protein
MQQGFLYLVAIIDWATRRVLSWRLSNPLIAGFCVEALSEEKGCFLYGTDGSNPSPSSSESAANPMSVSLGDWAIVTPRLPAEAAEAADRHLYFS